MDSSGKKNSFWSEEFAALIEEYEKSYGNPQKQSEIIREGAKIAKTPQEKLWVNAKWLQFKKDHGL